MPPAHEQTPHPANLSAQDHADLLAIETAINHMRAFIPPEPYILTIPQDIEPRYHHTHPHYARQWLHNTPFDYKEHEATQYQTFIYREPGRDMYQLHVSREAESERGNGDGSVRTNHGGMGTGTGANTPVAGQAPKKTISLSAYKKKLTGATPDPSSSSTAAKEREVEESATATTTTTTATKKPAVKGPVERIKADEEVLAAVGDEGEDVVGKVVAEEEGTKELKRKRWDGLIGQSQSQSQEQREVNDGEVVEDDGPAKKARRTSPPSKANGRIANPDAKSEQATQAVTPTKQSQNPSERSSKETKLPQKLSPPPETSDETALPPKLSPVDKSALPSRLSPTIPNNISATLKARTHYRSASRSSEIAGSRSTSKDPAARHLTPQPKTVPRNAFRANSSSPAVRSDTEERRGRVASFAPPRPRTPSGDAEVSGEISVGKKAEKVKMQREVDAVGERAREGLVVRLRFKKSQREGVRRILRMRPNPAKVEPREQAVEGEKVGQRASKSSDSRNCGRRDTNAKGVAQKVGPAGASNGVNKKQKDERSVSAERKRSRTEEMDDSDAQPRKRKKSASEMNDGKKREPSTPAPADLLSPSSAQRTNAQLSPTAMRKDVLSAAAMKREHSTDSRDVATPPPTSQHSPSVNGTSQPMNGAPKSSGQPSTKTPRQQAWESEQKRLELLGRDLKHAATDHLKHPSQTHSDSTAPSKHQKLAAIKSLESLLAYILAFTCADEAALSAEPKMHPSTKTWKSLHGFYSFVKRHCEPFPPLLGLACWFGVVFNARVLELAVQQSAGDAGSGSSRESILETTAMMQRAANEADAKLDVDLLAANFPKAWEGRFQGSLAATEPRLEVGKGFGGLYKLPLGLQTSPLRGARAGYAMLEEWVGKEGKGGEGLGYELRLKL